MVRFRLSIDANQAPSRLVKGFLDVPQGQPLEAFLGAPDRQSRLDVIQHAVQSFSAQPNRAAASARIRVHQKLCVRKNLKDMQRAIKTR